MTRGFLLKTLEWEMLIKTQPTTLLQIFCEFMLDFKFIGISNIIADDTLAARPLGMNGLSSHQLPMCFVFMPVAGPLIYHDGFADF